ncbi:DUF3899 domain-containing protein [Mesomycoplasma ovipneumoniae]|uniref:DUF3899 domain-containing protein n=2 Tax=Mesomycoplasma ovipneumoniae TaxID=29562 RepID=UPI0028A88C69|nr:DUF3899 domain-containing protein [Mesomycoplasma ovipneumoniae]MDW2907431.1 DUF3899 domain-containing protein [Mesomycoplasma ovipneumoniae]MDW2908991.1 DUF3899 domain-containing protein [Mesomycoplasma ovipneumoniae]MDW2909989.1 DUF3899 domain-containing protein [Mesomycoplasma ovipneumoniae]MDW2910452.1 DUF3899 domain-containing protein [Mesomycoplasma ovipneumoniae]MDW2913781.1 DUF3899 domain-containing protein [Mesomycoplasma ovipneumoniae]
MFIFSFFFSAIFRRKIQKRSILALILWALFLAIIGFVMGFVQEKVWYDVVSILGLLSISISVLATVLRLGLFSSFSISYHKWRIQSQNRMLEKQGFKPVSPKIDYNFVKQKQKELSILPIFLGFVVGFVLLIITLPFLIINS